VARQQYHESERERKLRPVSVRKQEKTNYIFLVFTYTVFHGFSDTSAATVSIKGIVSRDWAGLQMGSLDRSEFRTIPLEVYFLV
jgi:hypothetical protein